METNQNLETDRPSKSTPRPNFLLILIFAVWILILTRDFTQYQKNVETIPYSQFLSFLDQRKVSEVTISKEEIRGLLKGSPSGKSKEFVTLKITDPNLVQDLTRAGVTFRQIRESNFLSNFSSWLIPIFIMIGFWWLIASRFGQAKNDFLSFGKAKARIYAERDVSTRFGDVAGVDEAKFELQEVVEFLKNPSRFSKLGGRMPKGILMVGPPGTGKTLLSRAVAGEAAVPFFWINGSEFVELFVGLGAARVRDLFQQARNHAPCILFIDELDALGKARGTSALTGAANDEKEQTLNQLLAELDGFSSIQGLIVLGATNRPEVLDPALLRSGRFDRQIVIDKPDRLGRIQILDVHLRKIKLSQGVQSETVAGITAGFSGADLANLVNEAALFATRRNAEGVELIDFTAAIERMIAGLERKHRLINPTEKQRVAFHEMGHAVVALALGQDESVHKVSIIPRTIGALGFTFRRPIEDRYLMSRRELENQISVLFGGRASEMLFLQEMSTGAADDLDKATEIARAMVTRYGMSESLGLAIFEHETAPFLGNQAPLRSLNCSENTCKEIDHEIEKTLDYAYQRALACLKRYRRLIEEGANLLMSQETLNEIELKSLWSKHQIQLQTA
jgi:cell division protease FtsH